MNHLCHIFPLLSDFVKAVDGSGSDLGQDSIKSVLSSTNHSPSTTLLLASSSSLLRLPLLFQCAVTYASEGKRVLFICRKPLDRIPLSVHGMPPPKASFLKNIKFVYYTSVRDLISFCANVHTQTLPPEAVVVDDIDFYVQQMKDVNPEQALTKLCCLLIDAANFIQQKSKEDVPVVLAISDKVKSLTSVPGRFPVDTAVITGPSTNDSKHQVKLRTRQYAVSCSYQVNDKGLRLADITVGSGNTS